MFLVNCGEKIIGINGKILMPDEKMQISEKESKIPAIQSFINMGLVRIEGAPKKKESEDDNTIAKLMAEIADMKKKLAEKEEAENKSAEVKAKAKEVKEDNEISSEDAEEKPVKKTTRKKKTAEPAEAVEEAKE